MPDARQYPRPPIVEAVIEIRIGVPVSARDSERLRDRFKRRYEKIDVLNTIEVMVTGAAEVSQRALPVGYKMTSASGTDIILLNQAAISTIRLAPYPGWTTFVAAAQENFDVFTKVAGRPPITRLGVRFTNRVDIPNAKLEGGEIGEFFTVGIAAHAIASTIGEYYFNFNGLHPGTGAKMFVQNGVAQPALLDHTSILLDIDASFDSDVPQRIDELWQRIEVLRTAKNAIFESCITDKCRELFQ